MSEKTLDEKGGVPDVDLDSLVRKIEMHKADLQKHYDEHIGKDLICCSEDCWSWDISALINRLEMLIEDLSNKSHDLQGKQTLT